MTGPLGWLRAAWDFVFDVAKRWYYGGLGDLAAGVTFWILLTLPAAVLAMASGLGWLDAVIGQNLSNEIRMDVVSFVQGVLSTESEGIKEAVDRLFGQQNGNVLTVSVAIAFWTISRGFAGMIRALDEVYNVEEGRTWYYTRVVALILGLGSLLISVPLVLLEVYVWSNVADGGLETTMRWFTAVLILVFWASMLFHYGPSIRTKWRWDLPGSLVAAIFWWALTEGFRYYVAIVNGRNEVLSTIGAFLLALTWVWLAAQVLLIGAAVNTILGERLGLDRQPRKFKMPEVIFRTGEMKKVNLAEEPTLQDRLIQDRADQGRIQEGPIEDGSADQGSADQGSADQGYLADTDYLTDDEATRS